jgi:hypothetical protein
MHKPYEEILGHKADFRIKYKFYSPGEGGRKTIPFQGIRSDFFYDHIDHNHKENWIFMIWPEFEDENGSVILNDNVSVPKEGTARMWIIANENRAYHCERIKVGTLGHFQEGDRRTGECEVIQILDMCINSKA